MPLPPEWGAAQQGPKDPLLAARDPEDVSEDVGPEELDAIGLGLLRMHVANLIRPLGHEALAARAID